MNLFCVSKHLDTPGNPTQKNYHLANTDTRCYFLKSKKNASKKEESEQTDEKSNSKADQSDKNETDCRPNHANVNPQNKSQRNLISPEFETCCMCNHEIEQNERQPVSLVETIIM